MTEGLKIHGLDGLQRALRELPERVARKVARRATRRGAVVLQKAIRARAPRRTGAGRRNIRVSGRRVAKIERGRVVRYSVAPTGDAFYLGFYERGTSRQPARPFIRPAVEAAAQAALDTVTAALRDGIEQEARALRK